MRNGNGNGNGRLIENQHKILSEKISFSLFLMVKRNWIEYFYFTDRNGSTALDEVGIDLVWAFKPGRNGETGKMCLQEKRSRPHINQHFLRYPCTPVFLLKIGDSELQVEYVFINILLQTKSHNFAKEPEILGRKEKIERTMRKGQLVINKKEKRFWMNYLDLR